MQAIENEEIQWDERLWRYFKINRFISMLETSTLYFASPTQFNNQFDGAVAVQPINFPVDPRYAELDYPERAFKELLVFTKLNCWHRATYESDAMWKLYAGSAKGVAICSSPGRMHAAFRPFRLAPSYGKEIMWGI